MGAKENEWTEETIFSGIRDINHIEGEGFRLVIGSYNGIFLSDIEERKVVPSEEPVLFATRMLTFHFPYVCVIGGSCLGFVVLNIVTGKRIRHLETYLSFVHIHCNGRFVLVSEVQVKETTEKVIMYDMEELLNDSIKDTDLWSRRMS